MMIMKTLYLELNMGASGDMLMAALLDLIDDKDAFISQMNHLGLEGVQVSLKKSVKCGLTGLKVDVSIHGAYEASLDIDPESKHSGETDHDQDQDDHAHGHSHSAGHEHPHGEPHDHAHGHSHSAGHEHPHGETHDHGHGHSHSAGHEHPRGETHDHAHGHNHNHSHEHGGGMEKVREQVDKLPLSDKVKQDVLSVYRLIAEAEAKAHDKPVEEVHFHEVGALDAIADITGVCLLMEKLAPDRVTASPVHVGSGQVRCAHGILPVPAPATATILKGIPTYGGQIRGELCTPTGAALLRHFVGGFTGMPVMTVSRIGYGMGTKDFAVANCVRAFMGTSQANKKTAPERTAFSDQQQEQEQNQPQKKYQDKQDANLTDLAELSCNLDDMSGEAIAFAQEKLWENGALDVYTTPIQMKKNRPAVMLSCLCRPDQADKLAVQILQHTSTLGVRKIFWQRYEMRSTFRTRQTPYGPIRIKHSEGYGSHKSKPEYTDLAQAASRHQVSLETVLKAFNNMSDIEQ